MAASEQKNKDSARAKWLVAHGYPHGRRMSVTHCDPTPRLTDVGSAAYRRRVAANNGKAN